MLTLETENSNKFQSILLNDEIERKCHSTFHKVVMCVC